MKNQAIAACRVSTPEQRLSGSLNRQETSVLNAAQELEVDIPKDGWWSGNVSSKAGTNTKRKDLKQMLEYCKKHRKVKYLIVDETDRFMRSVDELFYFEVCFREIGVKVWYASEPELNTDDLTAKLLKAVSVFKAEGSNVERQFKSVNGHENAIKEGRHTFPTKPGYVKTDQPGIKAPHPITFKPFQRALKEVLSGLYTPLEALKRLNASEFSKVHAHWDMDKFRHFATDPYYAGILVVNKDTKQVKARNERGQHVAMITPEEHDKLEQIFNGTYKPRGAKKQYNPDFPMNKLLTCEDCGGEVKFTGAKGHNGFYRQTAKGLKPRKTINYYSKYRCRGCGRAYHRQVVHESITEQLSRVRYTGNQREELVEALETVWRQRQQDTLQNAKLLEKRRDDLEEVKSKLVIEMVSAELDLKADVMTEITKTKAKIEDFNNQINGLSKLDDDLAQFVDFALNYSGELMEDWWDLGYEDKLWCKHLVFPGGIMFNSSEKISTPEISPIYSLKPIKKDLRNDRKSLLVELAGTTPASDW